MKKIILFVCVTLIISCEKKINKIEEFIRFPPSERANHKIIRPSLSIPDSLGGLHLTGYADLDVNINKKEKLIGFRIAKLVTGYGEEEPSTRYSVFDSMTSKSNEKYMERFIPWINEYLHKCKFKLDTNYINSHKNLSIDTISIMVLIRFNKDFKNID